MSDTREHRSDERRGGVLIFVTPTIRFCIVRVCLGLWKSGACACSVAGTRAPSALVVLLLLALWGLCVLYIPVEAHR